MYVYINFLLETQRLKMLKYLFLQSLCFNLISSSSYQFPFHGDVTERKKLQQKIWSQKKICCSFFLSVKVKLKSLQIRERGKHCSNDWNTFLCSQHYVNTQHTTMCQEQRNVFLLKNDFGHVTEFQARPGATLNQASELHSLCDSSPFTYEIQVNHILKIENLSLP